MNECVDTHYSWMHRYTLIVHLFDMTPSHVWHDPFHTCDIIRCIRVTWFVAYVWHVLFIYIRVTWFVAYVWNYSLFTCGMIPPSAWHDSHVNDSFLRLFCDDHKNESCYTYEWVMSHIWLSHVSYVKGSCPWLFCDDQENESCQIDR